VGFAQDMSVHHLQAVTMANWARDHSTDPEIRQIAFDIQSTQLEQVGRMKGWLMLWGQPEQAIGAYMKWMTEPMGHGHNGSAPIPCPLTDSSSRSVREGLLHSAQSCEGGLHGFCDGGERPRASARTRDTRMRISVVQQGKSAHRRLGWADERNRPPGIRRGIV